MNVDYINPFLTSTVSVFETMIGWNLQRGKPCVHEHDCRDYEVSGIIGISGTVRGTVVLSMSRTAAIGSAEGMLDEKFETICADVADTVGELTNMIAGSAKAKFQGYSLDVSIPNVVTGKSHCVEFPRNVRPIRIPFESPVGPIAVIIGFTEPGNGK